MINDKNLHFLKRIDGFDFYEYKPKLFKQFYRNYEPMYFRKWIRFFFEYIKGYKVIYLSIQDTIVGYCVISKGGGRYSFATKEDIVVGPYYVLEEFRGNRYSEHLLISILNELDLEYHFAYDWIKNDNIPSIRCTEKAGFIRVSTAKLKKCTRNICIQNGNEGDYFIYRFSRVTSETKCK